MISGVSWRLFSLKEKTVSAKNTPQKPIKIQTKRKKKSLSFLVLLFNLLSQVPFWREMGQCWLSSRQNHRRGTELSTGTHSHPTPADPALQGRVWPEKHPQPPLLPLPRAAQWGILPCFAVSGGLFFFFSLSCLFSEYSILEAASGTWGQPGWNSSWDAGTDSSWQLGTAAWLQTVPQSPGPALQAGILMYSSLCLSFCRISSIRTNLKNLEFSCFGSLRTLRNFWNDGIWDESLQAAVAFSWMSGPCTFILLGSVDPEHLKFTENSVF